jgi:hypothetical protein
MNNPYVPTHSSNSIMVLIFSIIYKIFYHIGIVSFACKSCYLKQDYFFSNKKKIKKKNVCYTTQDSTEHRNKILDSTTTYHYIEIAISVL